MNRDLKDIIYIDFDDEKAEFHKDNVLILPRWEGDPNDREIYDIMPFLESNHIYQIKPLTYRSWTSSWIRCKRRTEEVRT